MTGQRVDLRSDTVTVPTDAMRQAMASAEVGDDVFGEDPTINALQERVGSLLGKETAIYVPSGSMANQIALKIHTSPGDEVHAGQGAHSWLFESGGAAAVAHVQVNLLPGDGRFSAGDIRAQYKPDNHHFAPTTLVAVENTHNMGGGLVWERAELDAVLDTAAELRLATHLDGARLWNAAAATGQSLSDLAARFDTVSVCFSKGLGAPVGSCLAGSRELVHKAHRVRKMIGGGMRQAGIIAAGALYALDNHRERLPEDHDNARFLAEAIGALPGLSVDLSSVQTNIIMVDTGELDATVLEERAKEHGVLFVSLGAGRFRLVTHLQVDRDACERAVKVIGELVKS